MSLTLKPFTYEDVPMDAKNSLVADHLFVCQDLCTIQRDKLLEKWRALIDEYAELMMKFEAVNLPDEAEQAGIRAAWLEDCPTPDEYF